MTKVLVLTVLALTALSGRAQTMKEIFSDLPDSILPTLTRNDRLDCIDFIENNLTNTVNNALDGKTRLTVLTDSLAKIQLSLMTEVQICKLPVESVPNGQTDGFVICLVHSSDVRGWDSVLRFYDSAWRPLDASRMITLPRTEDFIVHADSVDSTGYANIVNKAGLPLVRADFNGTCITLSYTSSNSADHGFRESVLPYVRPEIRMGWDARQRRFVRL